MSNFCCCKGRVWRDGKDEKREINSCTTATLRLPLLLCDLAVKKTPIKTIYKTGNLFHRRGGEGQRFRRGNGLVFIYKLNQIGHFHSGVVRGIKNFDQQLVLVINSYKRSSFYPVKSRNKIIGVAAHPDV